MEPLSKHTFVEFSVTSESFEGQQAASRRGEAEVMLYYSATPAVSS